MKEKTKKNIFLLVSFSLFVVGTCTLYQKLNPGFRFPAAVPGITYADLEETSSKQILEATDIRLDKEIYMITLGGAKELCSSYKKVSLVFTTPNMRVSGATPSLRINVACTMSPSGNLLVQIPFKEIMKEKPGDKDVALRAPASLQFQTRNVIGFWPEYWVLSQVEFLNEEKETSLTLSEKEVSRWTQNRISMQWMK